jgi:nucleoside-diphosphate-sugar epimerase
LSSKILITGGTGFLGSYIIKELITRGYTVRAIRREGSSVPAYIPAEIFDKVEWVQGDVLDIDSLQDAVAGIDSIIHSAAVVSFSARDRKRMYEVNVEGTANMVNLAIENNIGRFVHISSVAALGRTADSGHVDEKKKWEESKINTHYAKSKYKAEIEVWRGIGEGLSGVILNPATILGYGDWLNGSSAIFRNVYNEFKWYSSGINGFVDVEDVAKAAVLLMETDISEQRFIVNGDNWPFRKLMDTMAENFGVKKPSRGTTPLLMSIAWRIEKIKALFTGSRPLLTKESSRVAQSKTIFENNKIQKALPGFSFTPLNETIRNACKRYLEKISS